MRINIISILAPLASAALLAGCTKTAPERTWATDPDAVRIEASVGALTKTSPDGSEADPSKFLPGDEIAVSAEFINTGQTEKTVTYKFDGDVWAPVTASDYLVWKVPFGYRAWYPASAKDGFTLPTDQSRSSGSAAAVKNFENADFMTGIYVCDSYDKIPSDHKLKLVMNRKMALVTVNVDKNRLNTQFDGKDIYMIRVESIQSGRSIVDNRGNGSGDAVDVKPGPYDAAYTKDGNYHAIVVPCDGDASAVFLKVTVSWKNDDHPSGVTTPFTVIGRPTFEAGKHYTFNLTVGKDKIEAGDITVSDWGRTVDLSGDGGEQEADKASDPISMSGLRSRLKAWNDANPNDQKQLKDLITKELFDENCKNGKLIISGEFDNTTPAYEDTGSKKCYGMSEETLEAFEKIAEYVRTKANNVKEVDLSGLKGLTAIGEIQKKNGSESYDLSFYAGYLETFIGSPDITVIDYCFGNNNNLVSVSGLENVTGARGAFQGCRKLSVVPNMPKATNLRYTFSDTAIKELRHDNAEILAISDCASLEVIDCPKVNWLIGGAFKGNIRALDNLKELHLTAESFELVNANVFQGGIPIGKVALYLNENQVDNIKYIASNDYYEWRPKKADGNTSAVQAYGTTDYILLNSFEHIYCGNTRIK